MTIKELRAAHMMAQSQFAERLGIDRSDLGKYENGKKKITAALIIKVQDAFGVDLDVCERKGRVRPAKGNVTSRWKPGPVRPNQSPATNLVLTRVTS